jgi:hypothetical protein
LPRISLPDLALKNRCKKVSFKTKLFLHLQEVVYKLMMHPEYAQQQEHTPVLRYSSFKGDTK